MKLYYAPLACSLADHIALLEAGVHFEREQVDLRTKRTESGRDITDITGKSYVPALVLDDGAPVVHCRVVSAHGWLVRSIALRIVRSFLATAMRATLGGLPAAMRRWWKSLSTGLARLALSAAM